MDQNAVTPEHLARFALGELPDDAEAVVRAHLAASPASREVLERIRLALSSLETDDSTAAPRGVVGRAKDLLGRADKASISGMLDRVVAGARDVVASLVFDSAARSGLVGFRGPTEARHLTFACEQAEIDLEFLPPDRSCGETWRIRGQVSPFAERSLRGVRWGPSRSDLGCAASMDEVTPDEHGGFKVDCGAGTFDLVVWVGDSAVRVPGLQIPVAPPAEPRPTRNVSDGPGAPGPRESGTPE